MCVTFVVPTAKGETPLFVFVKMPQLSETEALAMVKTFEHWPASAFPEMFAGHVIDGFSTSVIVTVCAQVVVCDLESVAVQTTVFVPTGKVVPNELLFVTATPGQLSVAVAEPIAMPVLVQIAGSLLPTMLLGQVITGSGSA